MGFIEKKGLDDEEQKHAGRGRVLRKEKTAVYKMMERLLAAENCYTGSAQALSVPDRAIVHSSATTSKYMYYIPGIEVPSCFTLIILTSKELSCHEYEYIEAWFPRKRSSTIATPNR